MTKRASRTEKQAGPPRIWTEDHVRSELERFLAGRDEWPSYATFVKSRRKLLRDMVNRYGGARRWAGIVGVRYVDRQPGHAPIWTEERIRTELRQFLKGQEAWPSRQAFESAGKKPLRDAVNRTGGPERWAAEFRLPRADRRRGSRRVWTDEAIEAELRRLIGEDTEWPLPSHFSRAGLRSMLTAIYAGRGVQYWARRMGVKHRPARQRRGRLWDEARVRDELRAFCAGRDRWPSQREFEASGRGLLYRQASRCAAMGEGARA